MEILNALGALKDYVVYSLASTNYEYANIVAGFTQSITQWNGDGELTVEANTGMKMVSEDIISNSIAISLKTISNTLFAV